ncbi:MAG: hypothetical protein ACTHWA_10730 [Arachnia sp.]
MTLHTPVVITNEDAVATAARSRGWPVVHIDGDALQMTGVRQTIPLPEPSMKIESGSLSGPHVAGWKLVLDWLEKHLHRPMLVVQPNGWAQDLALWSASSRSWPVAAWIHGHAPVVAAAGAAALIATAQGVLFLDESVKDRFVASWPTTVSELANTPLINADDPVDPPPSVRIDRLTRVLLVAYYAGENPTVGVQRPTYWFDMLEELSGGDITVHLATAAPWPHPSGRVHHVPDLGPATLAPGRGTIETWATSAFAHAQKAAYAPTRHVGGYWQVALERYFAGRDDHYDVVIVTGNPFEYFGFAAWAQDHWYARTILDYRDPFALNPRRSFTDASRAEAIDCEKGWNLAADVVLVVHDMNRGTVVPSGPDGRVEVVGNGWDERTPLPDASSARQPGPLRVGHAGQFFAMTPPVHLLKALMEHEGQLHHMGRPLEDTHGASVRQYGRLPRAEVLERLTALDLGVAWITSGGAEMPTKVFDYLVAGLDVLVLSQGEPAGSALHDLMIGVNGVHFVRDNEEAISRFLTDFTPGRHSPDRAEPFSRRASTKDLVSLLRDLHPPTTSLTGR